MPQLGNAHLSKSVKIPKEFGDKTMNESTNISRDYIKYLATLCEGKNLLKEHEHYYDPETGMSYDDEGNSWRGKPNPKYDVSGYWPYSGRNSWWKGGNSRYSSSRTTKREPKVIDKDKLYFGRPARTDASLIYFLLQASGLELGTYKLPPGVDKGQRSYEQDIHALAETLCGCELGKLKLWCTADKHFKRIFSSCINYFKKDKSESNPDDVISTLKDVFEKKTASEKEES